MSMIVWFHGSLIVEKVHPLQAGVFRIKDRPQRRSDLPRENPLIFYPRRLCELVYRGARIGLYFRRLRRTVERLRLDPASKHYTDIAIKPVEQAETEELEMFGASSAAKAAVEKAQRLHAILEEARG